MTEDSSCHKTSIPTNAIRFPASHHHPSEEPLRFLYCQSCDHVSAGPLSEARPPKENDSGMLSKVASCFPFVPKKEKKDKSDEIVNYLFPVVVNSPSKTLLPTDMVCLGCCPPTYSFMVAAMEMMVCTKQENISTHTDVTIMFITRTNIFPC